jgi:hypothetical protein
MTSRTDTSQYHRIDVDRGANLRDRPKNVPFKVEQEFWDRVRDCGITRSKRRLAIMSMLATGWLPWGVRWDHGDGFANLPLCGRKYIMCCGHVMGEKEAQKFVDAGLLMAGPPDRFGRPTLVITDAGKPWLNQNW